MVTYRYVTFFAMDEAPDPDLVGSVDFCQPAPELFSPDPDPICYNGYTKLFSSFTKYRPE